MTTNRDFAAANAKSLARLASTENPSVRKSLSDMVQMMANQEEHGIGSPWYLGAKAALEADTDWHAEAMMYHNVIGRVKDFCDTTHEHIGWDSGERMPIPCECLECVQKRRILAIIAKGLK